MRQKPDSQRLLVYDSTHDYPILDREKTWHKSHQCLHSGCQRPKEGLELSVRGTMEVIKLDKIFRVGCGGYKTVGVVKTYQTVHLKTVIIFSKTFMV